jgi:hypothetical protein
MALGLLPTRLSVIPIHPSSGSWYGPDGGKPLAVAAPGEFNGCGQGIQSVIVGAGLGIVGGVLDEFGRKVGVEK